MEIYTLTRPSTPPAVWAPASAGWLMAATDVPQLPQTHQVQVQAEPARVLPRVQRRHEITGSNGANGWTTRGFLASAAIVTTAKKRAIDGVRGVPPRGRPV